MSEASDLEDMPVTGQPDPVAASGLNRRRLSSSSTLLSGTIWNLLGRGGPMVIAMLVTPSLIHLLGVSRWGVLSSALALVGMFGIFDFGIGRALTRLLAEMIGAGEDDQAASLVKTGICVLTGVGLLTGAISIGLIYVWSNTMMTVPPDIRHQVVVSLYVLCAAIPLVMLSGALFGVISAYQKFREANLYGLPLISFYYLGPLIAAYFTNSLVWVMVSLVLVRVGLNIVYGIISLREMPSLRAGAFDVRKIGRLLRIGGWMTVSNITFPILQYCDRLVLISVLSAAAAGYYSTPADLVSRFFIVVGSVMTSAFPAVAACYRTDPANAVRLFRRSVLMVVLWLCVPCLVAIGFAHPLLGWWIGSSYADHAAPVFRLLCLGVMFGGADQVVATFLDSIGRPAVNAKFSMIEIFIYIPAMAVLLHTFGIEGGAIAWSARAGIDFLLRFWLACRLFPQLRDAAADVLKLLAFTTLALGLPSLGTGISGKLAWVTAAVVLVGLFAWRFTLSPDEKDFATRRFSRAMAVMGR